MHLTFQRNVVMSLGMMIYSRQVWACDAHRKDASWRKFLFQGWKRA